MDTEQKLDFKNITKDDVVKLAAPHLNYVTFDYTNSDGVESERNLRVFGIKYHNKSNRYPYSDIRYYVAVAQRPKFKQTIQKCPYFDKGIIFYKCILQNSTYFSITHFSVFF